MCLGDPDQQNYIDAKLALLLQLCQTREGAKNVLHANLFRAIEQSGLFSVDPELQVDSTDSKAMERHYDLLVKVARIIGAAIVSRGSHNVVQGRRFLTEHRMLVMHVLKRSAGIGAGTGKTDTLLYERVSDLAEAFMVVITATGFLEVSLCYVLLALHSLKEESLLILVTLSTARGRWFTRGQETGADVVPLRIMGMTSRKAIRGPG